MANLTISGDTSGSVTLSAPAIAGSPVVTLPNATGTLALTSQIAVAGALIRAPQVLTSGTSYTTPANATAIYVEAVGGGGGGGGADNGVSGGGGGGAGAYVAKYFSITGNTAYTYAIGAGGSGGVGTANGTSGTNTTFTVSNVTITAGGGTFGYSVNGADNAFASIGSPGTGGTATNGDINVTGNAGSPGFGAGSAKDEVACHGGNGGASYFGGGGRPSASRGSNATGVALTVATVGVFGGGGAGNTSLGSPTTGSAGGNGIIRIWEFT